MPDELLQSMEKMIINNFCLKLRELMVNDKDIMTIAAMKNIDEAIETYEKLYP